MGTHPSCLNIARLVFHFFVKELLLSCTKSGETGNSAAGKEQEDLCSLKMMFLEGAVELGVMGSLGSPERGQHWRVWSSFSSLGLFFPPLCIN